MGDYERFQWLIAETEKVTKIHGKMNGLLLEFKEACRNGDGLKADMIRMEIHVNYDIILDSLSGLEAMQRDAPFTE